MKKIERVLKVRPMIEKEVTDMYKYLMGVLTKLPTIQGYSLPQDNIQVAGFICRCKGKITFMANPEIKVKIGSLKSNEGCESVKGRYIVKRPLFVKVQYLDENCVVKKKWFARHMSRIICHEYDHLCGLTIADVGERWKLEKYAKLK